MSKIMAAAINMIYTVVLCSIFGAVLNLISEQPNYTNIWLPSQIWVISITVILIAVLSNITISILQMFRIFKNFQKYNTEEVSYDLTIMVLCCGTISILALVLMNGEGNQLMAALLFVVAIIGLFMPVVQRLYRHAVKGTA